MPKHYVPAWMRYLLVYSLFHLVSPFLHTTSRRTHRSDTSLGDSLVRCAPPVNLHHAALKTRNITMAIQFYSLFGFRVDCRFRAGPARAAWLTSAGSRLELIEVPGYLLQETEGTLKRALDLMQYPAMLGYNHVALDVTQQVREANLTSLSEWISDLDLTSLNRFEKKLRVALPAQQQLIGKTVYELAFVYDADGALVELLHEQKVLDQDVESGWEPWNGTGFVS